MPMLLRMGWLVFAALCSVVLLGSLALFVASKQEQARLPLVPGASASLVVYRLVPDRPRVSLRFDAPEDGRSRAELGEWKPVKEGGSLRFANPGADVTFRVADRTTTSVYRALPAAGRGGSAVARDLVQFRDGADGSRFEWPPALPRESIPAGRSVVRATVLEVDPAIRGETVTVVIEPPLTFKRGTGGVLDTLWWFHFWPVYSAVLLIAGVMLGRATRRLSASSQGERARSG